MNPDLSFIMRTVTGCWWWRRADREHDLPEMQCAAGTRPGNGSVYGKCVSGRVAALPQMRAGFRAGTAGDRQNAGSGKSAGRQMSDWAMGDAK